MASTGLFDTNRRALQAVSRLGVGGTAGTWPSATIPAPTTTLKPMYGFNRYSGAASPGVDVKISWYQVGPSDMAFYIGPFIDAAMYSYVTFSYIHITELSCSVGSTLTIATKDCTCSSGYYNVGSICVGSFINLFQVCNYMCATCLSLSACVTCAGSFRTVGTGACDCNTNYYNSGTNPIC
jgi:hypothetical protein